MLQKRCEREGWEKNHILSLLGGIGKEIKYESGLITRAWNVELGTWLKMSNKQLEMIVDASACC